MQVDEQAQNLVFLVRTSANTTKTITNSDKIKSIIANLPVSNTKIRRDRVYAMIICEMTENAVHFLPTKPFSTAIVDMQGA